jgi:hypothetical protein
MTDTIIEAAARIISDHDRPDKSLMYDWRKAEAEMEEYRATARAVLAAVTPLIEEAYVRSRATIHVAAIRNAALEEAAQVAEDVDRDVAGQNSTSWRVGYFARHIRGTAAAIRALKEQP